MSAENAKEMVELLGDITQVGIVIEDMEKAKAGMLKVFGLKPGKRQSLQEDVVSRRDYRCAGKSRIL